jgi:hypothetical protein
MTKATEVCTETSGQSQIMTQLIPKNLSNMVEE